MSLRVCLRGLLFHPESTALNRLPLSPTIAVALARQQRRSTPTRSDFAPPHPVSPTGHPDLLQQPHLRIVAACPFVSEVGAGVARLTQPVARSSSPVKRSRFIQETIQ